MLFLTREEIENLHELAISHFGGIHGVRDSGGLDSAIQAPENRYHYEQSDIADLAATYAFHLCQAHAFLDGNKRVAALATRD